MSQISMGGIVVGILIGVILLCIVLVCNHVSKGNLMKGKIKFVIGAIVIIATVLISAKLGTYMGASIKEGDYSDRTCFEGNCGEPASCRVNLSMGRIDYYCTEHLDTAYYLYESCVNPATLEGEKCESCGNRYTDEENLGSLVRTHLCKKCHGNYKDLTD